MGTITFERSNVSITVERTEIRSIVPETPPTSIQSPSLTGRSISRMMPETKFDTMFCKPKPMPTDRAPATMARPERSMPAVVKATSAATVIPIYPTPEMIAFCAPRSIEVLGRTDVPNAPCSTRVITKPMPKTTKNDKILVGEMRVFPRLIPLLKLLQISHRSVTRAPQISASGTNAVNDSASPASAGTSPSTAVSSSPTMVV